MSDPSAKRQRLDSTGRFSPASPPFDVAALASTTSKTPIHPRTPTSPPYASMNSQHNGGFAHTTTAASSLMSPQSSVPTSQSLSQSATSASGLHPFPTPASTTGVMSSANIDSDGDAMMEESTDDDAARIHIHRPTNHNRQRDSIYTPDGRFKAAQGISGNLLFKVNKEKCEPSRPHCSQNLFKLYSLEPLASSVARNDPITGEKINKLRKSYEGHIKQMQIAGKPKATKMDRVFLDPLSMGWEDWHNTKVQGKEIAKTGLNQDQTALAPDFASKLDAALAGMAPGPLPNAETAKYRAYIGTDDTVKLKPQDAPPQRGTPIPSSAPTPNNGTQQHRGPHRPERAGSKRHYTDAAFQGYGEGYGDADSTGGEDNAQGNMAKRRKLFERTSHSVEVGGARR
ncbi:Rox3-domain-containing protein [Plenodomus tracheiphilus IPT5]|uniref:Mediator of RNA polymerase II transcription subunit 19 n=1 Tax=Plenodomus tracheiphilus IPT5 TaxID=1408161 RepID=A0A6A7BLL8_9PLEO|nr:Rox3-domain-containing protein [Plenodomus tracheiphilus IPT5]